MRDWRGELRGVVGEERRGEVRKRMDVPLQISHWPWCSVSLVF
jgi:hypothetical protein